MVALVGSGAYGKSGDCQYGSRDAPIAAVPVAVSMVVVIGRWCVVATVAAKISLGGADGGGGEEERERKGVTGFHDWFGLVVITSQITRRCQYR